MSIFKFNNINGLFKAHKIFQRQFWTLTKCNDRNSQTSNGIFVNLTCLPVCNKRHFIGFVPDRKDGYKTKLEKSDGENVYTGLKQLKEELKLWTEEMKETLRGDPLLICPPGSVNNLFKKINLPIK